MSWSDIDQLFMLITSGVPGSGSPTASKIYVSPDGFSWTLQNTLTSTTGEGISSLTCLGSLWIAVHEDLTNGDTPIYSVNKGLNWSAPYVTPLAAGGASLPAYSSYLPPVYTTVVANKDASQLLMYNRYGMMGSVNVGTAGRSVI